MITFGFGAQFYVSLYLLKSLYSLFVGWLGKNCIYKKKKAPLRAICITAAICIIIIIIINSIM